MLDAILEDVSKKIQEGLPSSILAVRSKLGEIVYRELNNSEEGKSLSGGRLKAEFGLAVDGETIIKSIARAIEEGATITTNPDGSVFIGIFRRDFQDALSSVFAEYYSVNRQGNRSLVPWLEWFLLSGGEVVLEDYFLVRGNFQKSRSGKAIMLRSKDKSYAVRQDYSPGNESNNWLTKTARAVENEIIGVVIKEAIK